MKPNGERRRLKSPPLEETLRYFATLILGGEMSNEQRAAEIGIDYRTLLRSREHTPEFELARTVAASMKPRVREENFGAYIFKQLSPEAQATWKKLEFWGDHKDSAQKIRDILSPHNKKIRQEIFIHALVVTLFDYSKACRLAGVDKNTLDHWRLRDLEFCQLIEEIQFHKKNFFEKAMIDLVKERHPLATIWANKTVNADRGYSERIKIEHTANVAGISFDDLDLDVDTRRKILEAIRKKQEKLALSDTPAIDVPALVETTEVAA